MMRLGICRRGYRRRADLSGYGKNTRLYFFHFVHAYQYIITLRGAVVYTGYMLVGNVHLVCGNAEALPALCADLAKENIQMTGPDAYVRAYGHFGVPEARELIGRAETRPVSAPHRTFVLAMPSMTIEAQNALLKTLEEPPAGAMFFFIFPSPDILLPTLRSRAQRFEMSVARTSESSDFINVEQFLAVEPRERLEMLSPLLAKNKDDLESRHGGTSGAGAPSMDAIFTFLSSLERALAGMGATPALRFVYRARKYIGDKGSLKKVLLEQVALLLPRM